MHTFIAMSAVTKSFYSFVPEIICVPFKHFSHHHSSFSDKVRAMSRSLKTRLGEIPFDDGTLDEVSFIQHFVDGCFPLDTPLVSFGKK